VIDLAVTRRALVFPEEDQPAADPHSRTCRSDRARYEPRSATRRDPSPDGLVRQAVAARDLFGFMRLDQRSRNVVRFVSEQRRNRGSGTFRYFAKRLTGKQSTIDLGSLGKSTERADSVAPELSAALEILVVELGDRLLNQRDLGWLVNSAYQLIEDVIVEKDGFTGAGALDVLDEVTVRIVSAADGILLDSPYDFFELLLPPGTVSGIREGHQFLDEIAKRIDSDWSALGDLLNGGNDRFDNSRPSTLVETRESGGQSLEGDFRDKLKAPTINK
jgi:hypothetical protein